MKSEQLFQQPVKDGYTKTATTICYWVLGVGVVVLISLDETLRAVGIIVGMVVLYGLWQGWFDGISEIRKNGQKQNERNEILNSIQNLNLKLDALEQHPEDWQTPLILFHAWPHWMKNFNIESNSDEHVQKKVDAVRERLIRITRRCEAIPLTVREAFVVKNKRLNFNLERWELNTPQGQAAP